MINLSRDIIAKPLPAKLITNLCILSLKLSKFSAIEIMISTLNCFFEIDNYFNDNMHKFVINFAGKGLAIMSLDMLIMNHNSPAYRSYSYRLTIRAVGDGEAGEAMASQLLGNLT